MSMDLRKTLYLYRYFAYFRPPR